MTGLFVVPRNLNDVICAALRDIRCLSVVVVVRGLIASTVPRVGAQTVCLADRSTKRVFTAIVLIDLVVRGLIASTVPRVGAQTVCLADRSTKRVFTALVLIDCPYNKINKITMLLNESLYYVILRNIKGVK